MNQESCKSRENLFIPKIMFFQLLAFIFDTLSSFLCLSLLRAHPFLGSACPSALSTLSLCCPVHIAVHSFTQTHSGSLEKEQEARRPTTLPLHLIKMSNRILALGSWWHGSALGELLSGELYGPRDTTAYSCCLARFWICQDLLTNRSLFRNKR